MSAMAPSVAKKGAPAKKAFALGTSLFPTPIAGLGGPLVYNSGSVSTLTPIPKTGFLGRLRFTMTGTVRFSTAASPTYVVPWWRLIQNYTLQNSLNYPYRSWNGGTADDLWFAQQLYNQVAGGDPVIQSSNWSTADPTSTSATQTFSFTWVDEIWHNDHLNFSRYLISAMTTSNDITINMTWAPTTVLQQNGAVISALSASVAVSAEFLTVPNPAVYNWPRRNLIQQQIGDGSYNTPSAGLNAVNLTPIQGPEFLGLGIQVTQAGVPISLAPGSPLQSVNILVNGSIPLYQFTTADLVSRYESMFRRSPAYGYLYLDFSNDLGLVNAMSHTHRKVLSTAKYSQLTVQVQLAPSFTGGAGSKINLFKRLQASYANNN